MQLIFFSWLQIPSGNSFKKCSQWYSDVNGYMHISRLAKWWSQHHGASFTLFEYGSDVNECLEKSEFALQGSNCHLVNFACVLTTPMRPLFSSYVPLKIKSLLSEIIGLIHVKWFTYLHIILIPTQILDTFFQGQFLELSFSLQK